MHLLPLGLEQKPMFDIQSQTNLDEFQNSKIEFLYDNAVNGFHFETIKSHWDTIIGVPQLEINETIRLVIMPSKTSHMAEKSTTGAMTDFKQIRNSEELIDRMIEIQGTEIPGSIGFAS